jgi:hypothetical protein
MSFIFIMGVVNTCVTADEFNIFKFSNCSFALFIFVFTVSNRPLRDENSDNLILISSVNIST